MKPIQSQINDLNAIYTQANLERLMAKRSKFDWTFVEYLVGVSLGLIVAVGGVPLLWAVVILWSMR